MAIVAPPIIEPDDAQSGHLPNAGPNVCLRSTETVTMSTLSRFLRRQRERRYQRKIDPVHALRRHLAVYVAEDRFEIGDYSYGTPVIRKWGRKSRLRVGKFCSIADGVEFILGGHHDMRRPTTFPLEEIFGEDRSADTTQFRGNIVIGSDVWIGINAIILDGVSIGDGAVVGAGAIVTRDIPPYSIAAGNPARVVRKRFPDEVAAALLEIRWWDLELPEIRSLAPMMTSSDIEAFIAAVKKQRLVNSHRTLHAGLES
jgi:acetyltransferase-like isoleucine patch superfamily enzyme